MILLLSLFILYFLPTEALAWGGGMHLQLGVSALENLSAIEPAVAAIISANPNDFLYGCISADITLGKKFTHYLLNCHRWEVANKILLSAQNNRQRACSYGYLCHLAADVIAHNYYVPYKIMRSFATTTMKHTYWEMRFETWIPKEIWLVADDVCKSDQRDNDQLMRSILTPTIFSFGTNKRIFNSIMLLSRLEKWQKIMQTLSDNSRYTILESDYQEYCALSKTIVLDFLSSPSKSALLQSDPTGELPLATAEAVRKNLRILFKSGKITKNEGFEQVETYKKILRNALQTPTLLNNLYASNANKL